MEFKNVYLVVRIDYEDQEVVRAFLDREEAEEFAATYTQHENWVEVEEMAISYTAPDADAWWEARATQYKTGFHPPYTNINKKVFWSDEQHSPYPESDPAIQVTGDEHSHYSSITVWSRDKMTAESILSNKVAQLWGNEAEDAAIAERKRKAMEFGAMFGSLLGRIQE
ncbi:hypothetical protein [Nocardia sp. NPDC057440]|uniref:hypothetical protein n=1 Tax=Nocardia sp. NPDC057440 TaxID=3346134 RepID=UPI0036716540